VGGGHVETTMPAMKMSSWKEEQEDRGDALPVLFSASSSSWISWSRQLALQNAFSPLQHHATKIVKNYCMNYNTDAKNNYSV
jgi:hypothetical protein